MNIFLLLLIAAAAVLLLWLWSRRAAPPAPAAKPGGARASRAPYKAADVDNFAWPSFIHSDAARFLVRRVRQAAADEGERRLFGCLLRRAYEESLELEILYRELPGVLKNEPAALKNFRDVLDGAARRGVGAPRGAGRLEGSAPPDRIESKPLPDMPDNNWCRPVSFIGADRILLIAQGAHHAARGDATTYSAYADTLRGLMRQTRPLEQLFRLSVEGVGPDGRDRLVEQLVLLGRDSVYIPDAGGFGRGDDMPGLGGEGWSGPIDDPLGGNVWPPPHGGGRVTWPEGFGGRELPGGGLGHDFHDFCYDLEPCVEEALKGIGEVYLTDLDYDLAYAITSLSPARACAGEIVTVNGPGFGEEPPEGFVALIGETPAEIVSWSDAAVEFRVPVGATSGCVGFRGPLTQRVSARSNSFARVAARATGCSGGSVVLVPPSDDSYVVPCTGRNLLLAGPPEVEFTINDSTDLLVEPGSMLTLVWHVHNFDEMRIRNTTTVGPPLDEPNPAGNTLTIGPFDGTQAVEAVYELSATNPCGVTLRTVNVRLQKTPALKIEGIEVIQAIQRFDLDDPDDNNSVRLVSFKRTVARVYVSSGIEDGFNSGAGPNLLPNVTGLVTVVRDGVGSATSVPFNLDGEVVASPRGALDRTDLTLTLNFELNREFLNGDARVEATVWERDHEGEEGWSDTASTQVSFRRRGTQRVVRILVRDMLTDPAPTQPDEASFSDALQGAINRYPIGSRSFDIELAPGFETIDTTRDLTTEGGWSDLLDDIDDIADDSEPLGKIWAAVVPDVGEYAWRGLATEGFVEQVPGSRVCIGDFCFDVPWGTTPRFHPGRFVARTGLRATFAHEMAHTFGVGHAPCGDPEGVDDRLPARTEDVGMDVERRLVIPADTPELMSYCTPDWSGDYQDRWPSIALYDILFDALDD